MEFEKQVKVGTQHYLASNIKVLRKRKKLSQEDLAHQIGLNRGNIASYENGTAEPRLTNLLRMAAFFGLSIIDLVQRDMRDDHSLGTITRIHGLCPQERAKLENLKQQAQEFEQFLQGIYTCFNYKAKGLQEVPELPRAAQFLHSHFEQLHAAAQRIAQEHADLLRMCHVKE